jgi:hypothetical protein
MIYFLFMMLLFVEKIYWVTVYGWYGIWILLEYWIHVYIFKVEFCVTWKYLEYGCVYVCIVSNIRRRKGFNFNMLLMMVVVIMIFFIYSNIMIWFGGGSLIVVWLDRS